MRLISLLLSTFTIIVIGSNHNNNDGTHVSSVNPTSGRTASFALLSGQHKELDAGFYELAQVAGTAFLDENADGVLQADETGRVAALGVRLIDSADGSVRAQTQTDEAGNYGFFHVDLGDVHVQFDVAGDWAGPAAAGLRVAARPVGVPFRRRHSCADSHGRSVSFRLEAGAKRVDVDVALFRPLTVGKGIVVFEDRDADSLMDVTSGREEPVANVSVHLFSVLSTAPLASVLTDELGQFHFDDVTPGQYWFQLDLPTGAQWSPAHVPPRADASIVDANGHTPRFVVDARRPQPPSVVGLYWPATLRACLFEDGDGDQLRAADDAGVPGARVLLLRDGVEVRRGTTDAPHGCASFDALLPGRYAVRFEPPRCERCRFGAQRWTVNDEVLPGEHVVLVSRDAAHLVQGVFKPPHVRGVVFVDKLSTGVHSEDALGVPGVHVRLLRVSSKQQVAATHTDADGRFVFSDFAFDEFFLKFERPDGFLFSSHPPALAAAAAGVESASACAPEGGATRTFSSRSSTEHVLVCGVYRAASLAVHFFVDSDADGRQLSPRAEHDVAGMQAVLRKAHDTAFVQRCVTSSGGVCTFDSLEPDDYYVVGELPAPREKFRFSRFVGSVDLLRVTVRVPVGTPGGLEAPRVVALAQSAAGALGLRSDDVVAIRNADVKAGWQCDILVPRRRGGALAAAALGSDVLAVEWIESGVEFASMRVSTFDTNTSQSGVQHLVSGEARSVGGGLFQLASVGGFVWLDLNGNGVLDRDECSSIGSGSNADDVACVTEQMAPNTVVELRRRADNGGDALVASTSTDANGRFDFVDVQPSPSYYLHFGKCETCKFSPNHGGADDESVNNNMNK
jgi:protocatechuate 3,4-dioxygenase beta subunit